MARIVAEHADGWSAWLAFDDNSPGVVARQWSAVADACAAANRDPGTLHRLACVSVHLTDEPFRFGPFDLAEVAIRGRPEAIAEKLRSFEGVADEVVLYSFPLDGRALEALAEVLKLLED